jgi:hypothetical protein
MGGGEIGGVERPDTHPTEGKVLPDEHAALGVAAGAHLRQSLPPGALGFCRGDTDR